MIPPVVVVESYREPLVWIRGSLGFVYGQDVLHIALLVGKSENSRRPGDALTNAEKVAAWKRRNPEKVLAQQKSRVKGTQSCSQCSGLGHKKNSCGYAGVMLNKRRPRVRT